MIPLNRKGRQFASKNISYHNHVYQPRFEGFLQFKSYAHCPPSYILLCFVMIKRTTPKIYLIDFACYNPPPTSQKASKEH
ncbi:hypothetical protein Hanom_Chr14g01317271 [Helianthus anomalus]